LAEHGPSVTAIVDSGPPGVDADLMNALPNLGAIVHVGDGYDTIDVDEARTLGVGVSTDEVMNRVVPQGVIAEFSARRSGFARP
jgi:lactate dehydrogenase-like 2-hydroxyacid dehydrogenase